ncbi:MAG: hypothetical protein IJG49_02690 [Erysipelotrichaceae bacterium]|nr:hypothetical protein [Erysipelotrichaceae bacterium]
MFDRKFAVGKDIRPEDIKDFYYTKDGSSYPPYFQRFRFYVYEGKHLFYHEKREGDHWPLRESDKTEYGTMELNDDEWAALFEYLKEGTVKARDEEVVDGDSGPWTYLYWKNDKDKYQEFSFASYGLRLEFEEFCETLKKNDRKSNKNKGLLKSVFSKKSHD